MNETERKALRERIDAEVAERLKREKVVLDPDTVEVLRRSAEVRGELTAVLRKIRS